MHPSNDRSARNAGGQPPDSMLPDSVLGDSELDTTQSFDPELSSAPPTAATHAQPAKRLTLRERRDEGIDAARDAISSFAPDYTGNVWRVWLLVVASALGMLVYNTLSVLRDDSLPPSIAWVMIGIAVIARIFPVEIRGARSDHVVSDALIACIALLHGAPLATLAIAAASSVETHMRTRRQAVQLFNASLHSLTLYALLVTMDVAYGWMATRVSSPDALMIFRALCVVAVLMGQLALYKALQQSFFTWKARSLGGTLRVTRGVLRINGADGASGLLAATLYLLICELSIKPLGQLTLFFATLMLTLPLHSRQRSASLQIQRLRMASMEMAARQANTSLHRVRVNEARFFSAFEDAAVGMAIIDPYGRILIANRALKTLLREPNLVARDVRRYVHREDVSILANQLNALVASVTGQPVEPAEDGAGPGKVVDLRCVTSDEQVVVVALHSGVFREPVSRPTSSDSGQGLRLIVQMQDVTLTHMAHARMRQYAYFDGLTRLRNRVFFTIWLERAMDEARKDPSKSFALMYLDFDRFKLINDLHGHAAGDAFLVLIAERLRNGVRPGDIVSRLGGDEFAILVEGTQTPETITSLGERILASLREPYNLGGVTVRSSASIGVALFGPDYPDVSSLMRAADAAMYRAKSNGRDQLVMFGQDLRSELDERLMIERDLAKAIERGELQLAYQPIFRLDTAHVVSLEALLRWTHPILGVISPQRLVTVAEETALMGDLTRWVIQAACAQARVLRQSGYPDVSVHVNVSGSDVGRPDFVANVAAAIKSNGIKPSQLVVEITESTLMHQLEQCGQALEAIRQMGVGISIDDFGTGYSSLAYLGRLPFNSLKIDRSFVCAVAEKGSAMEVIKLILAMAATLDKKVIAEGIETESQALMLRDLGCVFGQGYWVSKPIAGASLVEWLSRRQPAASSPGEVTQPLRQPTGLPSLDEEIDFTETQAA